MSKANKAIDYNRLLDNVDQMINLLEYDAMRGSGKCKLNAANLVDLYQLKDRYTKALGLGATVLEQEVPKEVPEQPAKRGPGRPSKQNK